MIVVFWVAFAVVLCAICSTLESVLLSVRIPELIGLAKRGNRGARWLLDIKRERVGDAISAILIVNTVASTIGPGFAGASAARLWGDTTVGAVSATLTLLVLFLSEIAPKTFAATHAASLAGVSGIALQGAMRLLSPLLFVTRIVTQFLAADRTATLTRKELAAIVSWAKSEGAISIGESELLANMIYIRSVTLETVNTPAELVFALDASSTVADLLASAGAEAFSRTLLYRGQRLNFVGFVDHRRVLKAAAAGAPREAQLLDYLEPLVELPVDTGVLAATHQLLDAHQSIALVVGRAGDPVGIVTVEDLLEAILGVDITDEADDIAALRHAADAARRNRTTRLRKDREAWENGLEGNDAEERP